MNIFKKIMQYPQILFFMLIFSKVCFARALLFDGFRWWEALYIELPIFLFVFGFIEWVFKKDRIWIYLSLHIVLSFCLFSMVVYYQYFGSMVTFHDLRSVNQVGDVWGSVFMLIRPSFWLLLIDVPFLIVLSLFRVKYKQAFESESLLLRNNVGLAMMVLCFVIVGNNALNNIGEDVINEHRKAEGMGLFSYQAYVVYADLKRDYTPQHELTLRSIQSVKGIVVPENPKYFGIARDQDIYIVQLEALQAFFVNLVVNDREVTPYMNQLAREGFHFPNVFQQIGKGNTADAEFITNTSVHTSGVQPMSTQFGNREVPSMPRYLSPYGYESVTLHTNAVHFWDRHLMYPALGFDHYYDNEYFGDDDIILFGSSDEVLYEKSMDIFIDMKARGMKIYANLIAMSSHGPFDIPEEKNLFVLPSYLQDTVIGKYIQAAHYADKALGQFIQALKDNEMWDNALLLVNGDHFGMSATAHEEEHRLLADLIGVEKYTRVEMFNIPLIIRVAGHTEPIVRETIGGQIDFLPTLANLIGLPMADKIYFGQDLLNHHSNLIPQRIYLPTGSFINDEVMFIPGKGFDDGWMIPLFNREVYPELEQYRNDFNRALRLVELSDSYLRGLPLRE